MTMTADPIAASAVTPVQALDLMSRHTAAPRRIVGEYVFHAPAETVFDRMTDPNKIAGWMGPITGGELDHSASENEGAWGAGSRRLCQTSNMGVLDERIVEWRPHRFMAYRISNDRMPIRDHAGYMRFVAAGPDRTEVEWAQYFNFRPGLMRLIFPMMMRKMMHDGMKALRRDLGGEKGRIRSI